MKRNFSLLTVLSLISFILINYSSICDSNLDKINKNLPKLLDANNRGTEFALGFFPTWVEDRPPNGVGTPGVHLFISSEKVAKIKVVIAAINWVEEYETLPNQVLEIIIPDTIAQMSKKIRDRDVPEPAQVYVGGAIMVTSDAPIVCYGVLRYPYTSDGYLALPVSALGREYVVAGYAGPNSYDGEYGQYFPSYTAIVAAFDNTRITFTYGGKAGDWVPTSDGDTLTAGESMTKRLNKGDLWLIPTRGPYPDITGSYVKSNLPVACFSGNFCAYVPVDKASCDYLIEQDIPMHAWGSKYYVSPVYGRKKNSILRLFASENSTTIYRGNLSNEICTLPSKYGPENEGWIEVRAAEGDPKAVTLFSDKRFNVVQYNPGQQDDGVESDGFSMPVISGQSFQNHITFSPMGNPTGLKYKTNYINLIYLASEQGKIPDDLQYGSFNSSGELIWEKISEKFGAESGFEFIDSSSIMPGRKYFCKQMLIDPAGIFQIRGNDLFGANIYGFSNYDSYGTLASISLVNAGLNDTEKPEVKFDMGCNGEVPDHLSKPNAKAYVRDMPEDENVRTNIKSIYFDKDNSFNYIFKDNKLSVEADSAIEWSLTPVNPNEDARAVINFSDFAGNDTTIVVEHWAFKPIITPRVKDFGKIEGGRKEEYVLKVTNSSSGKQFKFNEFKWKFGDRGFKVSFDFDPNIPFAPSESRDIRVSFTEKDEGDYTDSLGIGDGCNFRYVAFFRAGIGDSKISVTDANFPVTIEDHKSAPVEVSIKNSGNAGLVITGFKGLNSKEFSTDLNSLGISPETPIFIAYNGVLRFNVWFSPDSTGFFSDSISFESNAAENGDPICYLNGTGDKDADLNDYKYDPFSAKVLPNPLDSRGGQIEFENPSDGTVEIVLFNSLNRQVAVLQSGWLKAGNHSIRIPAESLSSGAYTFRIVAENKLSLGSFVIAK